MAKTRNKHFIKEAIISTIMHSTEDEDKVREAILHTVPVSLRDKALEKLSVVSSRGFHGNEIKFLQLSIKGKEADEMLTQILCNLDSVNRAVLYDTLDERIDKSGNLYIRMGKQEAYLGKLVLLDGDDSLRIVFKPRYNQKEFWPQYIK
jgi:RNA binding exosome subunit